MVGGGVMLWEFCLFFETFGLRCKLEGSGNVLALMAYFYKGVGIKLFPIIFFSLRDNRPP